MKSASHSILIAIAFLPFSTAIKCHVAKFEKDIGTVEVRNDISSSRLFEIICLRNVRLELSGASGR